MTDRKRWLNAVMIAALYVPGYFLYGYVIHRHVPQWSDLPGVLVMAAFFTFFVLLWERLRERRSNTSA